MNSDMRIVKFKMMIRDIWEDLGKRDLTDCLDGINDGEYTALLAIIYDYDKLNDYGKAIMDQVCGLDEDDAEFDADAFEYKAEFIEECKDIKYRLKTAKALVMELNKEIIMFIADNHHTNKYERKLIFIFWALMILAVDDTDKEEHLSLICDFAKMLQIGDEEIMYMVQIIRVVYHEEVEKEMISSLFVHYMTCEFQFPLGVKGLARLFRPLLERYGYGFNQ